MQRFSAKTKNLIISWMHFGAKLFSSTFFLLFFAPKNPFRFTVIVKYYFEIIFIVTTFFRGNKPKSINDCRLKTHKIIEKGQLVT